MKKRLFFVVAIILVMFCTSCSGEEVGNELSDGVSDEISVEIVDEISDEADAEESDASNDEADTEEHEDYDDDAAEEDDAEESDASSDESSDGRGNVEGMDGSGAFDLDCPCEVCGGVPTQMFPAEDEVTTGEPAFYCEPCTLICYFCGGDATTHYNKPLWGEIFVCQECYEGVHGSE